MRIVTISLRPILYVLGRLSLFLALIFLVPFFVDCRAHWETAEAFLISSIIAGTLGGILVTAYRNEGFNDFRTREIFLLTLLSWFIALLLASLPFLFSHEINSITDAIFETTSAMTTTGATILTQLDTRPRGILLWRSLLQWLGGIGIILMAITLLPALRIGGIQLMQTEFSDQSDKLFSRVSRVTGAFFLIYTGLTLVLALILYIEAMDFFDAICHAMSMFATGGMSTHDQSLDYFASPVIDITVACFHLIGATPLLNFVRLARGDWPSYALDPQVRTFFVTFFVAFLIVTLSFWSKDATTFQHALYRGFFFAASTLSTTGIESSDINPPFLTAFFFFLMNVGGCTGSTAGGIKIFRLQILYRMVRAHMNVLIYPNGVFIPVYRKRTVTNHVMFSVAAITVLYILSGSFLGLGLAFFDIPPWTSISLSFGMLSSMGVFHDIGVQIPHLPDGAKWAMTLGMILGRLEFLTLAVVLLPVFWRR